MTRRSDVWAGGKRMVCTRAMQRTASTAPPARCGAPPVTPAHPSTLPCTPPTPDADRELRALLSYPLAETLGSEGAKSVVDDNFQQVGEGVGSGVVWCRVGGSGASEWAAGSSGTLCPSHAGHASRLHLT